MKCISLGHCTEIALFFAPIIFFSFYYQVIKFSTTFELRLWTCEDQNYFVLPPFLSVAEGGVHQACGDQGRDVVGERSSPV